MTGLKKDDPISIYEKLYQKSEKYIQNVSGKRVKRKMSKSFVDNLNAIFERNMTAKRLTKSKPKFRSMSFSHTLPNKNNELEETAMCLKKRFLMKKLIGKGKQGVVYAAYDSVTKCKVAIKIVDKYGQDHSSYLGEVKIMKLLNKIPNMVGFPRLINTGYKNNYFHVTELLGESLVDIQNRYHAVRGMRLKHVLMIGLQLLKRIQDFHSIGYVHGDIKPANIVFGRGKLRNRLYLLDFGMSKSESKIRNTHTPNHLFEK